MNDSAMNSRQDFRYRDGSEDILLKEVERPEFNESETWKKFTAWPIQYHLSPIRKNLLRWHTFIGDQLEILELGAGCGALTSYLMELHNVKSVTAVEGSNVRSEIIVRRCRGNPKVSVVTSNIEHFASEKQYDIVTLIGVLEYSGKYIATGDPFSLVLARASDLLKKDGMLILAIENQLGHKYLAGFNEDHYKKPYEGLGNYPHYNGIRTFDKHTLGAMLLAAGFTDLRWLYPFPDYKMPACILTDQAFETAEFDWLSLLDLPTPDPAFNKQALYSERELLQLLERNAHISHFMNSFLIFAGKTTLRTTHDNLLAVRMRQNLASTYHSTTTFSKSHNGGIVVHKYDARMKRIAETPYYTGCQNLFSVIVDDLHRKNYNTVADHIALWLDTLTKTGTTDATKEHASHFSSFCRTQLKIQQTSPSETWLPPSSIDLLPQNCLIHPQTAQLHIIDQEWSLPVFIPLKLVVDRGLYYLLKKMRQLADGDIINPSGEWNLPPEVLQHLSSAVAKPDLELLYVFERWFQRAIRIGDPTYALDDESRKIMRRAYLIDARKGLLFSPSAQKIKKNVRKVLKKIRSLVGVLWR